MHADRVRSPDIESIAPVQVCSANLIIRDVVQEDTAKAMPEKLLELSVDEHRINRACCDAIRSRGGPMSHNAMVLK
jgi:hypothetical protein